MNPREWIADHKETVVTVLSGGTAQAARVHTWSLATILACLITGYLLCILLSFAATLFTKGATKTKPAEVMKNAALIGLALAMWNLFLRLWPVEAVGFEDYSSILTR